MRELRQCLASFLYPIQEPVGGVRIVLGYIPPEIIQVGFSLREFKHLRHQGFTFSRSAASRLRPRALMAPISKGVATPLSNPFLISAFNSSRRMALRRSRSSRSRRASRMTSLAET